MRHQLGTVLAVALWSAGCGGPTDNVQTPVASQEATGASEKHGAPAAPVRPLEELLQAADAHLKERNGDAALAVLNEAVQGYSQDPRPFAKRGSLLADAGLLPNAIQDLTAALQLDPKNPRYFNSRGYFFLLTKNYDWADKDFSSAVALDLQYPQPLNNRGLVRIARQDYTGAVREFEAALTVDPEYVDAHNNRGFALLQLDKVDEAIAAFTKALELNPEYVNALNNRGRAYERLEHYQEAVADFGRALELRPQDLQYFSHRAEAYRKWGRLTEARHDLEHVRRVSDIRRLDAEIAKNDSNADHWVQRGDLLQADGQATEASASYAKALERQPGHTGALVGQAQLAAAAQNWENVVHLCDQVLEATSHQQALSLRGDAHFHLRHLDESLADYSKARRMDSQVAHAYKLRSEQRRAAGQTEAADADLRVAVAFDPALGEGVILPASATEPVPVKRQFPSPEELEAFRVQQATAEAQSPPVTTADKTAPIDTEAGQE